MSNIVTRLSKKLWPEIAAVGMGVGIAGGLVISFLTSQCATIIFPTIGRCFSSLEVSLIMGVLALLAVELCFRLPKLVGLPFDSLPYNAARDFAWGMGVVFVIFTPVGFVFGRDVGMGVMLLTLLPCLLSTGIWLWRERRRQAAIRQSALRPQAAVDAVPSSTAQAAPAPLPA